MTLSVAFCATASLFSRVRGVSCVRVEFTVCVEGGSTRSIRSYVPPPAGRGTPLQKGRGLMGFGMY